MTTATFPVEVDFTPKHKKYAKGGLASKAKDVEGAGIGPDKILIHVNQKEYDWLKSQFGPPAKNPNTGLDTFGFFDFLIPAAASVFLGPVVGGVIGGALGLGETAAGLVGGALAGAGGAALAGTDPLTGALVGGGVPVLGSALGMDLSSLSAASMMGGATPSVSPNLSGFGGASSSPAGVSSALAASSNPLMQAAPYLLMASALSPPVESATFTPTENNPNAVPLSQIEFNREQTNPYITPNYGYGPEQQFFLNNALPSVPPSNTAVTAAEGRYVKGGGTGTSDDIPAKLSDGEYVIDAQTVSMLGDGSSDAGAAKLDKMRKEIRKHKGKSLAEGKFAPNAKGPLSYMKRT